MFRRIYFSLIGVLALVCLSCDSVPLLAPTNSTLTIDAQSRVLPTGGQTEVTATVIESGGTPVHNGTLVRFTTSLGRVDPVEAQTRNGMAVTTFFAGNDSGVAEVRATSGSAGSGSTTPSTPTTPPTTPTTPTPSGTNMVQISIGSGAVDTITVRANPATVSTNGGTVAVIANVLGVGGRTLPGITVSFSANRGTLSSQTAVTDASGEARVTLTTNADTSVTATAGSKTSAAATITAQPGPSVTLACAVGAVQNCAAVSPGQSVLFTAARSGTSSNVVSSTLDFGDGSSQNLGTLSSQATVSHSYAQSGAYTARLTATDANGETASDTEIVQVLTAATLSLSAQVTSGRTVEATATPSVQTTQFVWTFETGASVTTTANVSTYTYTTAGTKTVSVTATLIDGRTVFGSTTVVVP